MNLRILLCFALLASLAISCVKTTDPDTNSPLSCKIDGVDFETAGAVGAIFSIGSEFQSFTISGTTATLDPSNLTVIVNKEFSVGTYNLNATTDGVLQYTANSLTNPLESYNSISGTIDISEIDTEAKTVKGTFSAILELSSDSSIVVEITEGQFDVTYTE